MDSVHTLIEQEIKKQRGRPRLTPEQKEIRKQQLKQQNIERMRELRKSKPDVVSKYSKTYYESHKDELRNKRSEMYRVYTMYKQGAITV